MQTRPGFLGLTAAAVALITTAGPVPAGSGNVVANVNRVLIAVDARWGGCMAMLSANPQSVLPSCGSWWVTFSCTGDFTDRVRAYRMLDASELALATGKRVQVWFRDDKMHNGYCLADRLDIIR
ncbi:hypothetical protein [Thiocapsa roseopersicina]|uniref:Uncharacterized protein n=1 Tax=Thiocapsa roseopersicina TaxID=1058 RepID=A0A1H2RGW1_THIRO|nr:hypothetical protein [Thiocapsa roseopersicina]SDW18400.1 hypothetical protein SAMN05421783_10216 [Thiocapsa roseopersicina]